MRNTSPLYLLSLDVENIRCFGEKQTLDLSDGEGRPAPWTLLLGDNGVGKTTLLQCLTWMRTVEEPDKDLILYSDQIKANIKERRKAYTGKSTVVKPIMDDLEENTEIEALIRTGANMKSTISGEYSLNYRFDDSQRLSRKDICSIQVGMSLERRKGKLEEVHPIPDVLSSFKTPNLFAYSASRHMAVLNIDSSELRDPVANLFSDSADLFDAEQVLLDLDYKAHKEKGRQAKLLLKKVRQLLADLLPQLRNCEANVISILGPKGLTSDGKPSGVVVNTPFGIVSLAALSLGYKTMLAWSVDLALRLLRSNPDSPAPLEEPAIVIIDEIDLHLHPKWQRDVKNFLCEHFPNVQFICTAHSPFMAQAAEGENVAVLMRDGDHITIENNPLLVEGWRIDQIATSDLIGVPSARSWEVTELIRERRLILAKRNILKEDKERLEVLDEKISTLPVMEDPADQAAMDLIRQTAALLKLEK